MTAAGVYPLIRAGCNDAEILAFAVMEADPYHCRQTRYQVQAWLAVVRRDQMAGSGGESRSTI